jgi:hypothetical protein
MNSLRKKGLTKRLLPVFIILLCIIGYALWVVTNDYNDYKDLRRYYKKKYNFSTDWATHNIREWKRVLSTFKGQPNIHYLEVGVFEGGSLIWMLENIFTHPTSTVTGIDPLGSKYAQILYDNLKKTGVTNRVKIIKGFSQSELKKLPYRSFDVIYIDGDHSACAVLNDAILSWPLLKKGGVLIFDDYLWNIKASSEKRPQLAIDAFIDAYKDYIEVICFKYQCIIRKKSYLYWEKD